MNKKDVKFCFVSGESIQIFAEIENCSSRMVVPKAAIYQTQAFYAKGKMKEVKQLVANLRGESLSSGKTETWNGKVLKIPPVSPSILDCSIIRVEYSLMVRWVVLPLSVFSFYHSLHMANKPLRTSCKIRTTIHKILVSQQNFWF